MRSPCAFSAGANRRSTFITTVCGASFSKSWMPIETCSLKSRKKSRRSMLFLLLPVEGDIARATREVFATVDDQHVTCKGRRRHDEAQRAHQVVGRNSHAQRSGRMLLGKARVCLAATAQGEARRDAGHAQARHKGLR